MGSLDSHRVRISPEVLSCEISGESILLDQASGEYFGLNAIATQIWSLLAEHQSLTATAQEMLDTYDIDKNELETLLNGFVAELAALKLISVDG